MNIIVRMPNWIGDLVMATPVLTDLRKKFPNSSITAMCKRPLCELLERDQAIDELFCFEKNDSKFSRRQERRDIIGKIEAGNYDVGLLLTNSFSSAWWFWQGQVKRRIGYAKNLRSALLTDSLPMLKNEEHQVISYKRLLKPLGIEVSKTSPRLFIDASEIEEAKKLLYKAGYKKGSPLIGINPGASYGSAKCWPPDRFRKLAEKLLENKDAFIVFFGDRSTLGLVKDIVQGLDSRVMNLAAATTLRELAALIQECTCLVTNDSGPMHIGAAFNVPLIALFGSTDDRATGPYGQENGVIHKRVACSPCFKRECPIDFRCMTQIQVDEVVERVKKHVQDL